MRSKILPLGPLLKRFGEKTIVGDVAPFLTCKMCGSKEVRIEAKFPR